MPRMQVYLPDDLHREVKARGLKPSELLQAAVRAELRRQELNAEADRYVEELIAEFGEPTPEDEAWAEALARRVSGDVDRRAAG